MKITVTRRPDLKLLSAIHTMSFHKGWSAAYIGESMRVDGTLALVAFSSPDLSGRREGCKPAFLLRLFPAGAGKGNAVGFALLRIQHQEARLLSLAVRPAARGKGLGGALLEAALQEARKRQVKAVFLKVNERNAAAVSFYRKRGFFLISREENVYSNPDGTRSGAYEMRYLVE